MRFAVPALVAAAAVFSGPAAAQHPAIYPALLAAEVIGGLALSAAEAGPGLRGGYHHGHGYAGGHHGYAAAGGAYVQYYDPRSGAPVGGPVPVGEREYQRRAASVPYDAPRIHVRAEPRMRGYDGPRVVEERIEPVMRSPRWSYGSRFGAGHRFGDRHRFHGSRFAYGVGRGPSYGHVPRVAYGQRWGGYGYGHGPRMMRHGYGPRFGHGPRFMPRYVHGPRGHHGWRTQGGYGPRVMRHPGHVRAAPPRAHAAPPHRGPRGERSIEQMWNPGGQRRG